MLDICTIGIVSLPKRSALEISRRELSEDVSFGIGTLLVVQSNRSWKKRPQEGVTFTLVYGSL